MLRMTGALSSVLPATSVRRACVRGAEAATDSTPTHLKKFVLDACVNDRSPRCRCLYSSTTRTRVTACTCNTSTTNLGVADGRVVCVDVAPRIHALRLWGPMAAARGAVRSRSVIHNKCKVTIHHTQHGSADPSARAALKKTSRLRAWLNVTARISSARELRKIPGVTVSGPPELLRFR